MQKLEGANVESVKNMHVIRSVCLNSVGNTSIMVSSTAGLIPTCTCMAINFENGDGSAFNFSV